LGLFDKFVTLYFLCSWKDIEVLYWQWFWIYCDKFYRCQPYSEIEAPLMPLLLLSVFMGEGEADGWILEMSFSATRTRRKKRSNWNFI